VQNIAGIVHAQGSLVSTLELTCARCLQAHSHDLQVDFYELFYQPSDEIELEEDVNVHPIADEQVDLLPYIGENVRMAIPYIPLCSSDCKGLCQECGTNKNIDPCTCQQQKIDPRFAALADLFKSNSEK
jgi:uncharacterized protein